jgi:hypothetical protein
MRCVRIAGRKILSKGATSIKEERHFYLRASGNLTDSHGTADATIGVLPCCCYAAAVVIVLEIRQRSKECQI